jgi:two-component sensor histidine kinase
VTSRKSLRHLGLSVRIIALLTLALVPLGAIAVYQASRLVADESTRASRASIALTEQAAYRERQVIERAIGAADTLGAVLQWIQDDPDACRRYLSTHVEATAAYSFIGYKSIDGIIRCSSAGGTYDYSTSPELQSMLSDPGPRVFADSSAPISQTSVMVVMHPAYDEDGMLDGFVVISIPHESFEPGDDLNLEVKPFVLITFNRQGTILTSENGGEQALRQLPDDLDLATLLASEPIAFSGTSAAGAPRQYTVVPLVPGVVSALGSWEIDRPLSGRLPVIGSTVALVLLMWLASVIVAFFAVHQLVVRGVGSLARDIRRFATHRKLPEPDEDATGELHDLNKAFRDMAESIVYSDAALEDAVHEKQVLLKEVHHRVKNNLQLISSIMNLQLRRTVSNETRAIVRRLQDRVTAMAAIHRSLYQTDDKGTLNAGQILHETVNQLVTVGLSPEQRVDLKADIDDVIMYPDQAVPFSLMVSETVTNALKHAGGTHPQIAVRLKLLGAEQARVEVINTLGDTADLDDQEPSTGLGNQLITAFARQLDGTLTRGPENGNYVVCVTFPVQTFRHEYLAHDIVRASRSGTET